MSARLDIWSEGARAAIVAERGKRPAAQVAADYGTTRNAIIGVWHRARQANPSVAKISSGRPGPRPWRQKVDVDKAREMRAAGYRFRDIADLFGVAVSSVSIKCRDIVCPVRHVRRPREAA